MEAAEYLKNNLDDLLFEKRNKTYGAYFLRKIYSKHVIIAMSVTIALFLFLISLPFIEKYFVSSVEVKKPVKSVDVTALAAPPPLDKNTPPPPPPPHMPPPPKTVKFTPPVIKPDEEVKEVDEVKPQDEMKDAQPAATTNIDPNAAVNFNDAPVNAVVEAPPTKPQMYVEQMPQFPGGDEALHQYLLNHIKYPNLAQENKITGTVVLQFVVNTDGSISDIIVKHGLEAGCTEEAIRVVKSMPKWTPGNNNGLAVPVYFILPIVFQLQEN